VQARNHGAAEAERGRVGEGDEDIERAIGRLRGHEYGGRCGVGGVVGLRSVR
jgi:hypothetical protein